MSVNITLRGNYTKNCVRHHLLDDLERAKKEDEKERRKTRIQQVRVAAKAMAKKVRTDVEEEKSRQLKKLEEMKDLEMQNWRQGALQQQGKDFRSAIFQVGTAHRAAKLETARQQKTRDQQKHRKPIQRPSSSFRNKKGKENIMKNVDVQTRITGTCYPCPIQCEKPNNSEVILEDCENMSLSCSTDCLSDDSICTTTSVSDTDIPTDIEHRPKQVKPLSKLKKTKTVIVDVPPSTRTDTSIHRQSPKRHYFEVVSNRSPLRSKSKLSDKQDESKSASDPDPVLPSTSANAAKKRFTQISDILRQHKTREECPHLKPATKTKSGPAATPSMAATTASKSISSVQSQRSNNPKVQFYDYNNKFEKAYEQTSSRVEVHDVTNASTQANAMEQACIENKLRMEREEEMKKMRHKCEERCQKALEREQVRRACQDLTTKLDNLSKHRTMLPCDNFMFSSTRVNQMAAKNEAKRTTALEDILKHPAIITCPVVNRPECESSPVVIDETQRCQPYSINVNVARNQNEFENLNSSDSCGSILLGYVNGQSKQIADDIIKVNGETGENNKQKAEKLKCLLARINRLRENLLNELKICSASASVDKESVQTMMDSISELRKEREIILEDPAEGLLSKREQDLKKKEAMLEKKLKEFYDAQKALKKNEETGAQTFQDPNKDVVENDEEIGHTKKTLKPSAQTRGANEHYAKRIRHRHQQAQTQKNVNITMSSDEEGPETSSDQQQEVVISQKPVEIVIKVAPSSKTKKKMPSKSPRKLSSLVPNPVIKMSRRRSITSRSSESASTSYRSLPPTMSTPGGNLIKQPCYLAKGKECISIQTQTKKPQKKSDSNINPLMAHYVQRLLGMSRKSIKSLGVSTSDIDTPSSSVMNTPCNITSVETEKQFSSRLQNVQKFVEENYSFLNDLEESLRCSESLSSSSSSKKAEVVWKKTLEMTSVNKKVLEKSSQTENKKIFKPILKKCTKQVETPTETEVQPSPEVSSKLTQSEDNRAERIAQLSEMINKVRQEKQRILENTLSSHSGPNSADYLDLPDFREEPKAGCSKSYVSADHTPSQTPDIAFTLEKNKATTTSRDSGISESRPITAQESHDDLHQVQSSAECLAMFTKKSKPPPVSISRYSPQLVEDVPHELSTIFEVDTPIPSKPDCSVAPPNSQTNFVQPVTEKPDTIKYKTFPTFDEYVRLHNLDMTRFDPEFSAEFEKEFNEFIAHAKANNPVKYDEFISLSKYMTQTTTDKKEIAEELLSSLKVVNISYRKFPNRKEYLANIGASLSDFIDSHSLENIEESKTSESSMESLMNVEKELKMRNILNTSFNNNRPVSVDQTASSSTATSINQPEYPNNNNFGSSMTSEDLSNKLETELERLGINWPSTMKKRTLQTQALTTSSSSSCNTTRPSASNRKPASRIIKPSNPAPNCSQENNTTSEDEGRPLNLLEFLTKELLKRTTSSSLTVSDDSLASSILRSIVDTISPSSSQRQGKKIKSGMYTERHKTSTPVDMHSSSTDGAAASRGAQSRLFSGESRISSVRFINSSVEGNEAPDNNACAEPDKRD